MALTEHDHIEALHDRGFTVIERAMTSAEIEQARHALDAIFESEAPIGPDRGWHTASCKAAYMLPAKDPLFVAFCQRHSVLSLARAVLGERCVLSSLNGLTMIPGGSGQRLHIDQHETVPGMIVTLHALHMIDDFTRDNGATRVVPGSHNRIWSPDAATITAAEAEAIQVEAPAGSVLLYSGALWHAASPNRTQGQRRAVHVFFARPWVLPDWDYRRSLSPALAASLTEEQRVLFGFAYGSGHYDRRTARVSTAHSPARWRSRLARLRAQLARRS